MRKNVFLLLSLVYLVGCSHNAVVDQQSETYRTPASNPAKGCFQSAGRILRGSNSSRTMQEMIAAGDLQGVKETFWEDHLQRKATSLKPQSSFYRRLRRINKSYDIPALYQKKRQITGNVDTFSTIIKAVDDSAAMTDEELEAIDDVMGWITHVSNYESRVNHTLNIGHERRQQVLQLENRLKDPEALKKSDFPQKVEVPFVGDDGKQGTSTMFFDSRGELEDFIKQQKDEFKLTFATGIIDRFFKKGKLYHLMIDQAVYMRRLQLVRERINSIPVARLSSDQKALKELVENTLSDPKLMPREDAMKYIRRKELWKEFWSMLKIVNFGGVAKQAKFTLPQSQLSDAQSVSLVGKLINTMLVMSALGLGTGAITPSDISDEHPRIQYVVNLVKNYYNHVMLHYVPLFVPSAYKACYKAERTWTLENQSTMNDFIESQLSRYTSYSRIDRTYDPEQDPEYVKKKVELQAMCAKKRAEYKAADRHTENMRMLDEHGYRFATHMLFVNLIDEHHPKGDDLAPLVHTYLEEEELFEDEDKANQRIREIQSLAGKEFVADLQKYQKNVGKAIPLMRSGRMNMYYPSASDFVDSLEELPKE